jgi:hypothetical protein
MWNDTELGSMLERLNPVPDPEALPTHGEELWASLSPKRTDVSTQAPRPRHRPRTVLVAVGLVMLLAVPAVALWLDDSPPPLDRDFNTAEEPMLTVFGTDQGLPDGCAWRIAFTPTGTPLAGGHCGVLELTDGRWNLIADKDTTGLALMDLAVDGDGGIWVASPDQPLRHLSGETVVEMEIASPYIALGYDGTIWAVDFPYAGNATEGPPTLVSYSAGLWRHIGGASVDNGASEGVHDVAVGSDGTVWILIGDELARVTGDRLEVAEFDDPDNRSPMFLATAPDGAIWIVVESNDVIDRLGVSDVLAYIVRYDGSSSTSIEVPFAEINDLAVHPDGTVWASSPHGVFSYNGQEWTRYGMPEGMPINEVDFVEIAPDGSIYAGTARGLAHIRTDR